MAFFAFIPSSVQVPLCLACEEAAGCMGAQVAHSQLVGVTERRGQNIGAEIFIFRSPNSDRRTVLANHVCCVGTGVNELSRRAGARGEELARTTLGTVETGSRAVLGAGHEILLNRTAPLTRATVVHFPKRGNRGTCNALLARKRAESDSGGTVKNGSTVLHRRTVAVRRAR